MKTDKETLELAVTTAMKDFDISRKVAISYLLCHACAVCPIEEFGEVINYFNQERAEGTTRP